MAGAKINSPLIADEDPSVGKLYNMLPADVGDSSVGRTAADNQTVRVVFLIAPDKTVKVSQAASAEDRPQANSRLGTTAEALNHNVMPYNSARASNERARY